MKSRFAIIIVLIGFLVTSSCNSLLKGLSDSLYQQKDIVLVKEGAPSYMLLVEGLIKSTPNDKGFLLLGIQLYSAYSGAFVKDEDRRKIFAAKTKDWAVALLRTYSGFVKYEKLKGREEKEKALNDFLKSINKSDIEYLFWSGNAWISWILANLDNTDAFLDLPIAKAIIDRVYKLDDKFYYGAPHLFYGVFYAAFPKDFGGNPQKAKAEFEIALKLSEGKLLMTKLYYADFYLKPKNDKAGYEKILKEVIDTDLDKFPDMRLVNSIMQVQAKEMLEKINDVFFDDVPVQQ